MYRAWWSVLFLLSVVGINSYAANGEEDFLASPPLVMGALGDSITTAVNAAGWGATIEENWSTGASSSGAVYSHYRRLSDLFHRPPARHNFAQGGATSSGLEQQVNKLLPVKPDYVTVLIGANDLCSWHERFDEQIAAYHQRVKREMQRLIAAQPQVKIYLTPIPNLYRVWEVGRQHNCQWFWDFTNICSEVFHSSRTTEQRQAFVGRMYQINAGLQTIAEAFPHNIKFDASLVEVPLAWEHISSYDCFHPSLAGQNLIAERTWTTGWYAP